MKVVPIAEMPADFGAHGSSEPMQSVLRTWASLGADLLAARSPKVPDWKPLDRMIHVARRKLAGDAERLQHFLNESRKRLAPLEDPFDVDLGLHRWLDTDREEAYSDWLEWVVRQAKCATHVFNLFGLPEPSADVAECQEFNVQRECCIPHGHEDQEGRLDLVIRYGNKAIIAVEVKKGDAEGADTVKHSGYSRWLEDQDFRDKSRVLVAVAAEQETYKDFRFVSWASVCLEMRRLAVTRCGEGGVITAAMILAFVAAVESNLLGFSAGLVKDVCKGRAVFFNPAVVDHLERFVNQSEA